MGYLVLRPRYFFMEQLNSFFIGTGLLVFLIPINAAIIVYSKQKPVQGMMMTLGGMVFDLLYTGVYTTVGLVVLDLTVVPFVIGIGFSILANMTYKSIHALLTDHKR